METATTQKISTKKIIWDTNYNGKLGTAAMVHVDFAPIKPLSETHMRATIIQIQTKDRSHPDTYWRLEDLLRLRLHELGTVEAFASHGLGSFDFAKWFMQKHDTQNTQIHLAIYFYRKAEL